jgi:NAD(P)-dependent dehydrogenase (short-subunit alcohol dehydrogenase family)
MEKICLITGANAGIGRAAAQQLAALGHTVLLGCRDLSRGEAAAHEIRASVPNAKVSVLEIDMSLRASIERAAQAIPAIDVLIHNAAYFDVRAKTRLMTSEGVERTWATNYLGPALLTELLLDRLKRSISPRVVAVTSKGLVVHPNLQVDLDDLEFQRRPFRVDRAYYQSKLAHLAWMLSLSERHPELHVHGVRVTNVKIDLERYPGLAWPLRAAYALKSMFSISPDAMARTYTWLAADEAPGQTTGGYWDSVDRPASISKWAASAEHRARLMAYTDNKVESAPA